VSDKLLSDEESMRGIAQLMNSFAGLEQSPGTTDAEYLATLIGLFRAGGMSLSDSEVEKRLKP
jgi:hypothetical protein